MITMAVLLVALTAVTVVGCLYLVVAEWSRYSKDRAPQPPIDPELAASDRWHNGVTYAIAALSIVGALLAWQASEGFDGAGDLSRQAVDQGVRYQSVRSASDGRIDFDARLALIYQEHLRLERSFYTRADELRAAGDNAGAARLEAEARVEGAQARLIASSFLSYFPIVAEDGSVSVDRDANAGVARAGDTDLRTLDPANVRAVTQEAGETRRTAQQLVVAGALLIAAMFFLTVADLGWLHRRLLAAVPAALATVAALVILVVAEF